MAGTKDTAVFFRSIYEAERLIPEEDRGKLSVAVQAYLFDGAEPDEEAMPPLVRMAWVCHKPVLKAHVEKTSPKTAGPAPSGRRKAEPKKAEKKEKAQKAAPRKAEEKEETQRAAEPAEPVADAARKNYSDRVYEVFESAGLPCSNRNPLAFYMGEFKNGLASIRSNPDVEAGIHSDDIIQACRNYVSVLKDPDCYVKMQYGFSAFVRHKNFAMYLPANFVRTNFVRFGKAGAAEKIEADSSPAVTMYEKLGGPRQCRRCGSDLTVKDSNQSSCNAVCQCGEWVDYDFHGRNWAWMSKEEEEPTSLGITRAGMPA